MTVTLKINPYSNRIVAPIRYTLQVDSALTAWTTDTEANIKTDTGEIIRFKQDTTIYPLEIEVRPYSNRIVALEKR